MNAQTGNRVSKVGSESWAVITVTAASPGAVELPLTLVTWRMMSNVCGLRAERKSDGTAAHMKESVWFLETRETRHFLEILCLWFSNVEQNNGSNLKVLGL